MVLTYIDVELTNFLLWIYQGGKHPSIIILIIIFEFSVYYYFICIFFNSICSKFVFETFALMVTYWGAGFDGLMDKIHQAEGSPYGGINLDCFFSSLKRVFEKKARVFWNNKYFQKYIDKNFPWGLCIQIFLNVFKIEPEFKTDWELL